MKVFLLFPTRKSIKFMPKFGGGSEIYLHDLSTGLAMQGLEVHVIANFVNEKHDFVNLHHVDFSGNILMRNWKYFKVLYKTITKDSVVIIFDQAFGGYMPLTLRLIRRFKLIFHTTNHYPWLETQINPRLYWPILKSVVKNSDYVVVGNKLLAESITRKSPISLSKIRIIPQSLKEDDPLRKININVREKYGIGNDPLILYVGRIIPYKGISDIIQAAKIVLEKFPKVKFFLVGPRGDKFFISGKDKESDFYLKMIKLRNALSLDNCIKFTGVIPREEVYSLFKSADVFIFPSYKEGFGTAVLEAMSFGKPIIAYDHPPVNEIINNTGVLVKLGDIKSLAKAIIELIMDSSKAIALGKVANKRFKMQYSFKAVMSKWINLLEELSNK